mmetsp:Transcript_4291/g.9232  ORF Transcript_4291/g.9232 Transcript_4291/m.9232 type:complete len:252 (+) Transcript_4291:3291-4046(+)
MRSAFAAASALIRSISSFLLSTCAFRLSTSLSEVLFVVASFRKVLRSSSSLATLSSYAEHFLVVLAASLRSLVASTCDSFSFLWSSSCDSKSASNSFFVFPFCEASSCCKRALSALTWVSCFSWSSENVLSLSISNSSCNSRRCLASLALCSACKAATDFSNCSSSLVFSSFWLPEVPPFVPPSDFASELLTVGGSPLGGGGNPPVGRGRSSLDLGAGGASLSSAISSLRTDCEGTLEDILDSDDGGASSI